VGSCRGEELEGRAEATQRTTMVPFYYTAQQAESSNPMAVWCAAARQAPIWLTRIRDAHHVTDTHPTFESDSAMLAVGNHYSALAVCSNPT
jgi:hypothetical protein